MTEFNYYFLYGKNLEEKKVDFVLRMSESSEKNNAN